MSDAPVPKASDWLFVSTLGVLWGASFMAMTVALDGFGPVWVAATRIGLAAVALWGVARLMGYRMPDPAAPGGARVWTFAVGLGLFSNAFPFLFLAWGQQYVTSGFAGIMMAAVPLFTLALAHVFVPGERLTALKIAGLLLGLAGVVILIGPAALIRSSGASLEAPARIACIMAAACYAIGSVITRRGPSIALVPFSAAALAVAAALMVPAALVVEGWPELANPGLPLVAVLYLGLGPTALATLLLVTVIRSAGPGFLSQVNYQVPVFAVIFGTLILDEALPPQFLGALGLILAGLGLTRARAWRRRP